MVYLIGVLMGYFTGTNALIEKRARTRVGARYGNPTLGLLSSLGGIVGIVCILVSAYFVSSDRGNGFLEGLMFVGAVFVGAMVSGFLRPLRLGYLLSAMTIFIDVALTALVLGMTH